MVTAVPARWLISTHWARLWAKTLFVGHHLLFQDLIYLHYHRKRQSSHHTLGIRSELLFQYANSGWLFELTFMRCASDGSLLISCWLCYVTEFCRFLEEAPLTALQGVVADAREPPSVGLQTFEFFAWLLTSTIKSELLFR